MDTDYANRLQWFRQFKQRVNASPPPYGKPTHDSRPRLVANHYHAGDFHPLLFAGFYRRFRLDPFVFLRMKSQRRNCRECARSQGRCARAASQ